MTAVLLHLSDIHIKTPQDPILSRSNDIAACVFSYLPLASHVFVVVSGDIAYSGEASQFSLATEFLSDIRHAIEQEAQVPVTFITTPGNHDCDFNLNTSTRKILVEHITGDNPPGDIDKSIIDTCTEIQKAFFSFRENLEANNEASGDKLWRTSEYDVDGQMLAFECLNVSWISKLKEDPGRLFFQFLSTRTNRRTMSMLELLLYTTH